MTRTRFVSPLMGGESVDAAGPKGDFHSIIRFQVVRIMGANEKTIEIRWLLEKVPFHSLSDGHNRGSSGQKHHLT
jgi:hypothetical protein